MNPQPGDYDVSVRLEPEVSWSDVAPILDELQEPLPNRAFFLKAERWNMRPGAGGPGFDIMPIAVTIIFGPLVAELIRDVVYPYLKDRLLLVYRNVAKAPRVMELRPLGLAIKEPELNATFRFPPGLSDSEFASALGTIVTHFAVIRAKRKGVVLLEYDPSSGSWEILEQASEFLTASERRGTPTADSSGESEPAEP